MDANLLICSSYVYSLYCLFYCSAVELENFVVVCVLFGIIGCSRLCDRDLAVVLRSLVMSESSQTCHCVCYISMS